jgi:ATP-binding cassette subfamily B protein
MKYEDEDFTGSLSLKAWSGIFSFAGRQRGRLILVAACMALVAAIDAAMPFFTGYVSDRVIGARNVSALWPLAIAYIPLVLAQISLIKLFMMESGRVEMGLAYEMRKAAFKKVQDLSFSYFDRTSSGWLMARLTSDISRLADVMAWGLVDIVWGGMMMLLMAVFMFLKDWRLALATLSVVPALALLSVWFEREILRRHRASRKANSRLTNAFSEGIRGMQTLKTLRGEGQARREFGAMAGGLRRASTRASRLSALYLPLVVAIGYVGTALALSLGGKALALGGISYGTLVSFFFCSTQFFDPVTDVARVLSDFQYAQANAERVLSLLGTEPEIKDSEETKRDSGDYGDRPRPALSGAVRFEGVGFSYGDGPRILSDFNLDVPAGTSVALVGETGSGKSTVVNLACRFYEPSAGRILIDGLDYRERSVGWLHSNLGYVLQSPYLFSGTIRENIRYGRLDAEDAEVEEAARVANADAFIRAMTKGYETEVGEGGNLLSTGQKQLISLARAVLADPRILVLDEATSSVDTETELSVQEAVSALLKGRTSFVVAHRLSTIVNSDTILVLQKGKVVERGTHPELMALGGYYERLFSAQFMEEEERRLLGGRG